MILLMSSPLPLKYFHTLCSNYHHQTCSTPFIIKPPFNINVTSKQSNSSSGGLNARKNGDDDEQPLAIGTRMGFCSCGTGRRHFITETATAAAAALLPMCPSHASAGLEDQYMATLNKVHPSKPDWYEELYAHVLDSDMESFEAEVAAYKSQLFASLRGKAQRILELGIGTGPNLKYYAGEPDIVKVLGVDPNRKMEKYAKKAALAAGLPIENFNFVQAVGEAIPLLDASVDAVVGTLVLCSVKDVDQTLKEVKRVLKPGGLYLFVEHVAAREGSILRFLQNMLDPLQQTLSDGCHLTRETGNNIFYAGFSHLDLSITSLSSQLFLNPLVYGIASK
ncbi:hypothetical protein Tsubulata_028777 [Turnera subulata]|uniref:Methyltransferase type 11 domain-containing protein n=1 Tax=Turnera subulata TaxID=218843 RepID=A0A9Q0G9R0_9ROSI|nr:hypothetical protein Tsubulata_028777 [Turnera subulata]